MTKAIPHVKPDRQTLFEPFVPPIKAILALANRQHPGYLLDISRQESIDRRIPYYTSRKLCALSRSFLTLGPNGKAEAIVIRYVVGGRTHGAHAADRRARRIKSIARYAAMREASRAIKAATTTTATSNK